MLRRTAAGALLFLVGRSGVVFWLCVVLLFGACRRAQPGVRLHYRIEHTQAPPQLRAALPDEQLTRRLKEVVEARLEVICFLGWKLRTDRDGLQLEIRGPSVRTRDVEELDESLRRSRSLSLRAEGGGPSTELATELALVLRASPVLLTEGSPRVRISLIGESAAPLASALRDTQRFVLSAGPSAIAGVEVQALGGSDFGLELVTAPEPPSERFRRTQDLQRALNTAPLPIPLTLLRTEPLP